MFFRTCALITALAAVGCGSTAPEAPADAAGDTAPIDDVRSRYVAAFNAGDAAAVAAFFAEDAVSMPDHGPALEGRAAIQQQMEQSFAQYSPSLTVTPSETEVVGDLAHEHGTFSITMTPKAGGAAMSDNGKYLVVLKREADGAWLIHHDIDNSSNPPPTPPAAKP